LRAAGFFRVAVFLLPVFLRVPELDRELDAELAVRVDFADDLRAELFPPPPLEPVLDAPSEPVTDWIRRLDASNTTAPAPPTAFEAR
jgi:hypothetical protein